MQKVVLIVALMGAVGCTPAFAHGGCLDKNGCHTNRKTGDYHCHRAPSPAVAQPQQSIAQPSPSQPRQQVALQPATRAVPGQPTCYVGPRGGTNTITASGRKNYSGC